MVGETEGHLDTSEKKREAEEEDTKEKEGEEGKSEEKIKLKGHHKKTSLGYLF